MISPARYRWLLIAILAVAFALRFAAGMWWEQRLPANQKFGFPDSEGYWELARTIARRQAYEYGPERYKVFRTPGYPIVLAPLFLPRDEPPVMWGRVISAALGTLAVGGVAALAQLLFDRRTALIAAAITAIYPEAIALSTFILSEAPFCPLMLFQLVAWTAAWKAPTRERLIAWSIAAGVCGGLATLMRPSWLLFLPFAAVIGLVCMRDRKRQMAILGISLLALCLTMTPWWVRNYRISGRFVPTSLQVGASLYDGLNPEATGASDMRYVPRFVAELRAEEDRLAQKPAGLFEDRLDQRMRDASIAWARQNPERMLQLAGVKLLRMWNPLPNAAELRSWSLRIALAATFTPVAILALLGAWRFAAREWPYLLCVLPAVYFTCLHVIFVSSIRYRQPAMLVLIVLAAGFLTSLAFRPQASAKPPARKL